MHHRALLGGSAALARSSHLPSDSCLSREIEVLRGLQAEDEDFEDALPADKQVRREQVVHGVKATSGTLLPAPHPGARLALPSWQLSQSRDGGAAFPTGRGR